MSVWALAMRSRMPGSRNASGLAERVVEEPDQFEIDEDDVAEFNYRAFAEIQAGRPWLSKALDQEKGTQVGDFAYGPGTLFTSKEVAQLAIGLVAEAKQSEGEIDDDARDEFRDFAAFFTLAAQAQKSVLTAVS